MSVLLKTERCSLLDHRDFITKKVYQGVSGVHNLNPNDPLPPVFTLIPQLFCIKNAPKNEETKSRKRPRSPEKLSPETLKIKQMYEEFIKTIPEDIKKALKSQYDVLETGAVRELAQNHFESKDFDHKEFCGDIYPEHPTRVKVGGDGEFYVPKKAGFYCGDVVEKCQCLPHSHYNMVIADPPWWNKYIRRLKGGNDKLSYKMMYNKDIAAIPVAPTMSADCLVAMWCTNAPSNVADVKHVIFPAWGVEYQTTWYWMKVSIDLEPICPFSAGSRKQPYERLLIGKRGNLPKVPEEHVFMSVPSALHSHKPPLLELLEPYTPQTNKDPRILELFARYLMPNTTSVGFEPLKWSHSSLYECVYIVQR